MKPVLIDLELIEPGSTAALITSPSLAACDDLPAAITPVGHVVSRWRPTPAEREAIARGADLYVYHFVCGHPLQPIGIVVGPEGGPIPRTETPT